jgi:hypothetical protein
MRPAYADGIRLLAVSDAVTDDVVTDVVIVTDVANVMGARADGWWRDRAGAALRLCREIAALAARGIPADRLPSPAKTAEPLTGELFPAYVLVLEGRARDAAGRVDFPHPGVLRRRFDRGRSGCRRHGRRVVPGGYSGSRASCALSVRGGDHCRPWVAARVVVAL